METLSQNVNQSSSQKKNPDMYNHKYLVEESIKGYIQLLNSSEHTKGRSSISSDATSHNQYINVLELLNNKDNIPHKFDLDISIDDMELEPHQDSNENLGNKYQALRRNKHKFIGHVNKYNE